MKTILIVEDNEKNMKLTRELLRAKGYATLEAVTGQAGVQLALEHRPDLILMDIQLPDIDGIQALERIRQDPAAAAIPVMAFTASVTAAERGRIAAAGFAAFVSKPIDVRDFLASIAAALGQGGSS
jgi:two-component system cell cycle response regulator DivK